MVRFAIFVDGSNLSGGLRSMNVEVKDYQSLFTYLFKEGAAAWTAVTHMTHPTPAYLHRVYWYALGFIDQWDLSLPQSQTALRKAFDDDTEIRRGWLASVGKVFTTLKGADLENKAWTECFNDFKGWYEKKCDFLVGLRRFHQGVRIQTDLIDVIECGHWRVNFLHKWVEEKRLDTALAVDMVAFQDSYDIAIVVSGDADSIPSIHHCKRVGKQVASVEFISGSPPEDKGRGFSSRLKEHADFVIRVYETELIRHKIAARPTPKMHRS
jgi:uncharacterized LabA/DUF88 family protein